MKQGKTSFPPPFSFIFSSKPDIPITCVSLLSTAVLGHKPECLLKVHMNLDIFFFSP